MRIFFNILALLAAFVAIFLVSSFYRGYVTANLAAGENFAVAGFQLYGIISSALSLFLGLISTMLHHRPRRAAAAFIGRRRKRRPNLVGGFAMLTGALGFAALISLSIFG